MLPTVRSDYDYDIQFGNRAAAVADNQDGWRDGGFLPAWIDAVHSGYSVDYNERRLWKKANFCFLP